MPRWFERIINRPAMDRTFIWLDESHDAPAKRRLEPETCYIWIRIKSARIPRLRHLATKYHLSVVSWLDYRTVADGMQKATAILSPDELRDLDAGPGDRLVFMDAPILRAIPWAGELQLKTALFAVVEANLAKPILDYLVSATDTLGFGFAGPAKVYADLINKASDAIFGTPGSTELLVGLDRTFQAEDFQSGYLFLSDAPAGTFKPTQLRFNKQDNRILYEGETYQGDFAYMLVEFGSTNRRIDWADFEDARRIQQGAVRRKRGRRGAGRLRATLARLA